MYPYVFLEHSSSSNFAIMTLLTILVELHYLKSARCTGSEATAASDYMRTGLYAKPIIVRPVAIVLPVY